MLEILKSKLTHHYDPHHLFLKQAIRTALAGLAAIIIYRYKADWTQGYWVILVAAFLMQTRLGPTQSQRMLTILISGISAASLAFVAGLCWNQVWLLALFLSATTFIAIYLSVLGEHFAIASFFANLFAIMSAGLITDSAGNIERFWMIVLGSLIALTMSLLWPSSKKNSHRFQVSKKQSMYALIQALIDKSSESRFQKHLNKLIENFNFQSRFFRRALRVAIAIFASVFIYRFFSLTQGFWIPLTVTIVMQATTAASLRKGLQRFLGTLIGIVLGSLLILKINDPNIIDFLLVFFLFVAYYLKSFIIKNYGIFVVPLTIMVVFLVSALVPQESHNLILARLYDTTLGAIIGIIASLFIFPNSLKQDIDEGIQKTIVAQYKYLNAIVKLMLRESSNEQHTLKKRHELENCLLKNRLLFRDWIYELWLKLESKHRHEHILLQTEKMAQSLVTLHQLAKNSPEPLSSELKTILHDISQNTVSYLEAYSEEIPRKLPNVGEQIIALIAITEPESKNTGSLFIASLLPILKNHQQSLLKLQNLLTE